MINPIRRNRNIGTAKQGYGKNNELVVPYPAIEMKSFFERLGEYNTIEKVIKNHRFKFVVEKTRQNSYHSCTIEDIEQILYHIPENDYGDLELIVLRQPTRKEENLKSVWGRLIYSYDFENDYQPAIIIEAVSLDNKLKWNKKLSIESQKELKRLKDDGHKIKMGKRFFEAEYELLNIRTTQLYRTLPHEFGHYVHYLNVVKRPLSKLKRELDEINRQIGDNDTAETNPLYDKWDSLDDAYFNEVQSLEEKYFSIPTNEKEVFAHSYAEKFKTNLEQNGIIPFDRILREEEIINNGFSLNDFKQ